MEKILAFLKTPPRILQRFGDFENSEGKVRLRKVLRQNFFADDVPSKERGSSCNSAAAGQGFVISLNSSSIVCACERCGIEVDDRGRCRCLLYTSDAADE